MLAVLASLIVVVGWLAAPAVADVATSDHTISGPGEWTLAELGYRDAELEVDAQRTVYELTYVLPPGVTQGPLNWFQLRLDVDLVVDASAMQQAMYVSANTQQETCAQIKITSSGDDHVLVDSLDLVNGVKKDTQRADAAQIRFQNYLRDGGVMGGTNRLQVVLEQPPSLPVERATLKSTSALIWDSDSPYDIEFSLPVERPQVFSGEPVEIPYLIVNNDAKPVAAIQMRVAPDSPDLKIVTLDGHPLTADSWVNLGDVADERRGVLSVLPTRAGEFQALVFLRGAQENDRSIAILRLSAADRPRRFDYIRFALPGVAVIIVGLVLFGVRWTGRTERASRD